MIQNFNFYDIYGYFLPGFTLLALFWLPYGIRTGVWPQVELSSALAAVAFSYVVGHLLQTLTRNAAPAMIKDSDGNSRYPSDAILDKSDETFPPDLKSELAGCIRKRFAIDVRVELGPKVIKALRVDQLAELLSEEKKKNLMDAIKEQNPEDFSEQQEDKFKKLSSEKKGELWKDALNNISTLRRNAFLLCRDELIKSKIVSYTEQFQGMYVLMIGLTAAFSVGFIYNMGWTLAGFQDKSFMNYLWLVVILLAAAIVAMIMLAWQSVKAYSKSETRRKIAIMASGCLLLALLPLGYNLGLETSGKSEKSMYLGIIALASLFSSIMCFTGYKYFVKEFAVAVYRTFYANEKGKEKPAGSIHSRRRGR